MTGSGNFNDRIQVIKIVLNENWKTKLMGT